MRDSRIPTTKAERGGGEAFPFNYAVGFQPAFSVTVCRAVGRNRRRVYWRSWSAVASSHADACFRLVFLEAVFCHVSVTRTLRNTLAMLHQWKTELINKLFARFLVKYHRFYNDIKWNKRRYCDTPATVEIIRATITGEIFFGNILRSRNWKHEELHYLCIRFLNFPLFFTLLFATIKRLEYA